MSEENLQPEKPAEPQAQPDLASVLNVFPGSPTKDQLELWKQQFGEIFCSGFSETELFVWRPLSRREYVDLQKRLRTAPQDGQQPMTEFDYEEQVVSICTLWSSVAKVLSSKGGSISTLSEQVMQNSNFMPPQLAAAYVIKL